MEKQRLDMLLVNRGFFQSRERARSSIMAGIVFVNGQKADKPGTKYPEDVDLNVKQDTNPYVSRGGLKLEKALEEFEISLEGKTAIDVGASTGGFTDCMLKNGALKVFAIDVGYGQLAWELRNDSRVFCMERTNIRYVKQEDIGVQPDFASIDVSFISLSKVLPVVMRLIHEDADIVCLVKPQFEAGRNKVGKHGVVREPETHREVLEAITAFSCGAGLAVRGMTYSPIKGPEGNIEYLLHLSRTGESIALEELSVAIMETVLRAHADLDRN